MDEKDLGQRFGVTGFPTLKFFPAGDEAEVEAYNEARDLESLVKFINKKASQLVLCAAGAAHLVSRGVSTSWAAACFAFSRPLLSPALDFRSYHPSVLSDRPDTTSTHRKER